MTKLCHIFTIMIRARHHTQLVSFARNICSCPSDADDLMQNFYEKTLSNCVTIWIGYKRNKVKYLYRVLKNIKLDEWRRMDRLKEIISEIKYTTCKKSTRQLEYAPEIVYQRCLDQIQTKLTALDLDIFILYFIEGYTYKEIGKKVGLTTSATGVRILRIREKIKDIIDL